MSEVENLSYHRKYRPMPLARYIDTQKLKEISLNGVPVIMLEEGSKGCGKVNLGKVKK